MVEIKVDTDKCKEISSAILIKLFELNNIERMLVLDSVTKSFDAKEYFDLFVKISNIKSDGNNKEMIR